MLSRRWNVPLRTVLALRGIRMAKNGKTKRASARAGAKRAKATKKAIKRKRVVALKQPEAVTPAQDTAPRTETAAARTPLFFWPYDVLRWWMPRDAARKGT